MSDERGYSGELADTYRELDGVKTERDELRRKVEAVRALHRHRECGHCGDPICDECGSHGRCPTIRVLDEHYPAPRASACICPLVETTPLGGGKPLYARGRWSGCPVHGDRPDPDVAKAIEEAGAA